MVSVAAAQAQTTPPSRSFLRLRSDESLFRDAFLVGPGNDVSGYFAAAGGPTAPPTQSATTGDILFGANHKKMIFSTNAGTNAHMTIMSDGRVGIGTVPLEAIQGQGNFTATLDVGGWPNAPQYISGTGLNVSGDLFVGNTYGGGRFRQASNNVQGFLQWNLYYNGATTQLMDSNKAGYEVMMSNATQASPPQDGIYFSRYNGTGGGPLAVNTMMAVTANGVGIGRTPDSQYKLHVQGPARFEGSVTGTNIAAHFQDLAEWVPVTDDLAPGTVVVVKKQAKNTVTASTVAYDTSVAGVVSAQPGITLGVQGPNMVQVATTGRVKVRVDASKGAVEVGDLLVTSDVPGTAMRSEPTTLNGRMFHQPGTLIGKALEPLDQGIGEILVLLSLQ